MADNRKYYYLKLKENFFDSDSIVLLEDMKDGILYSNILLKLYLKSLKNGGKLQLDEHIPYTAQMIATLTRHQIGTVERALEIFRQLGLVEQLDSGAFYMTDIELMIGQSSTEAERKRAARLENKALLPPRTKGGHLSDIRPPEIEIELEKEIKIEKEIDGSAITTTKRKRFEKPSISDIKQYCMERNNNVNAEQFYDYYESNGWKVGKNSMKDWQAAVRTWERSEYRKPNSKKNSKEDAINVVNNLMNKLGGVDTEQPTTDFESTIDVTDSVVY